MQNATQHNSDQTRFLKIYDIIGNRSKGIPPLLPICRTTFLQRVKDGTYPAPIKLGERSVAWRQSDILDLLDKIGGGK